jgi:hypothetical protein
LHLHAEDIDLYARRGASEPTNPEFEAHLADCRFCRSKLSEATEFAQSLAYLRREADEMRDSHRVPTDDPATLQVLSPVSPDHWEVRIRNVSKGGMGIRTPRAIDRGALVKVHRGTLIAFGEVRYCIPIGDAFHVGIPLREVLEKTQSRKNA